MTEPILSVEKLNIHFGKGRDHLHAVRDLSFAVARGETLAIVGESGCGKSITALALMGLLPRPGHVAASRIALDGQNLLTLGAEAFRRIRGNRIGMIFQEPMTALNPVLTIGEQISEAITEHEAISPRAAREHALALIEKVRIPDAVRRFGEYPHQLSGGMRQRVMIAMAIAGSPAVLIADEPTTALDVTIQAEILELIDALKRETGTAVVLITHDLGLVSEYADRVLVMYAGRKVEERRAASLFAGPLHPYTRGLIAARPQLDHAGSERKRLKEIPGLVPSLRDMPHGCAFAPRCDSATAECRAAVPPLETVGDAEQVACIHIGQTLAAPAHQTVAARV